MVTIQCLGCELVSPGSNIISNEAQAVFIQADPDVDLNLHCIEIRLSVLS